MARRPSEFSGRTHANGVWPETPEPLSPAGNPAAEREELTAQEKMRLVYSTGQDDDSTLKPDPKVFLGQQHRSEVTAEERATTRDIVEGGIQ